MPIAIVIGAAPVVVFTGPQKLPIDCDEMAVAGALAGAPIRTVKCVTVDLDVPADAEFVSRFHRSGIARAGRTVRRKPRPCRARDFNMSMQVTAITHKRKPVWVSILSEVTPSESKRDEAGRL